MDVCIEALVLLIILLILVLYSVITIWKCKSKEKYMSIVPTLLMVIAMSVFIKINFKELYSKSIFCFKDIMRCKLNEVQDEMVEDAKSLIQNVDDSIVISDFNVYNSKLEILGLGGFYKYDYNNDEACVFIDFSYYDNYSPNLMFEIIVHEVIHAQNAEANREIVFTHDTEEGLTQYFTLWLINNYADEYKIQRYFPNVRFYDEASKLYKITVQSIDVYDENVEKIKRIFEEQKINTKEAFINYINYNPEYFIEKIPTEYLKH